MQIAGQATNKLIILSILHRIRGITLNHLTTLALETLYMDYFDFVTAFEEMCRDHMVVEGVRKNETLLDAIGRPVVRCDLTEKGSKILQTLENRIPLPIRSYLAQACTGWQKDSRLQSTLTATCEPDANGFFLVSLKQNDGIKDLVDLRLTIPEKNMALQICERWKRSPQMVYLGLLSVLTGEPVMSPGSDSDRHPEIPDAESTAALDPMPDPQQQSLFPEESEELS